MRAVYAVTWQEAGGNRYSGRLEAEADRLRLRGGSGPAVAKRRLLYADIDRFHVARSNGDRLQGRPTLVLELADGSIVRIASVAQPGIVAELAEHLAGRTASAAQPERAALVVHLREGTKEKAAALLREGPPFDPRALGLERHEVYLTDGEVIFVFEGVPSAFVQRLAEDETIWDAASAWGPLISGRIAYADQAFAWAV